MQENYEIMRRSMVLRAALVPYIYTHAREAYDEGLSLLRPMYYEFPEEDNAYIFDKQVGLFYSPFVLINCMWKMKP